MFMSEQWKDSDSLELLDALEIGFELSDYEIKTGTLDEEPENH